jgi:hypothetical protein
MSVSQVTTALNCVVLIYSTFCLLQDILTKEIIRRDLKWGDSTTWMISAWAEHITCIIPWIIKSDRFGFGIAGLDIRFSVI